MNLLVQFIRYLQGERRGMGSQLKPPTESQKAKALFFPSILIPLLVKLADVSFYQGVIDFVKMKAAGVRGVVIRAGQNVWVDVKFAINWLAAKLAGLPRGSYFFYDSRKTPQEQALLWWNQIKNDVGELFHVADFEESYGGAYGTKAHFKEFILEFQRLSGLPNSKIVIYTGFFWWQERVGNDPFFRQFRLWLAWYAPMANVRIPAPWYESDLVLWQYTSAGDGIAHGVESKEIDLDWFNGDEEAFNKLAGLVIGGEMIWYKAQGAITMRTGAATSFPNAQIDGVNQYVLIDDLVETSQQSNGFVLINRLFRDGGFVDLPPVAWCGMAYLVPSDAPVPPLPSVFVTHTFNDVLNIDGVEYKGSFTVENVEYKPGA